MLFAGVAAAVLVLGVSVGTASARRLELSSQTFRAVWNPLVFSNAAEGIELRCPVTLEGSFHSRTLAKVAESLVGYVTRAQIGEASCSGSRARVLTEFLPWHVRYESFAGTLPTITSVTTRIIGFAFLLEVFGVSCLYVSEASHAFRGQVSLSGGVATAVRALESPAIPKHSGSFLCPTELAFRGTTSSFTVQNSTTAITVRLVQ